MEVRDQFDVDVLEVCGSIGKVEKFFDFTEFILGHRSLGVMLTSSLSNFSTLSAFCHAAAYLPLL